VANKHKKVAGGKLMDHVIGLTMVSAWFLWGQVQFLQHLINANMQALGWQKRGG